MSNFLQHQDNRWFRNKPGSTDTFEFTAVGWRGWFRGLCWMVRHKIQGNKYPPIFVDNGSGKAPWRQS